MSTQIHYVKVGSSYQLVEDYVVHTSLRPSEPAVHERIVLNCDGKLLIRSGYCWDGTSGPVIDRKSNMRAGCIHDALYHLMRIEELPIHQWRNADKVFDTVLKEDGAWALTRKVDALGLRIAGGSAALPKNRRKILSAYSPGKRHAIPLTKKRH